ncbi:MAG: HigA family addiction module antidote protein [Xanthobacteraceae bacterium]|nr:HigA family addiction module antidote protein [Xanthobacteraceae bacterium]
MKSEKLVLASPMSPGELLRKRILGMELEGGKLTQEKLAEAMQVSRFSVNQIINGKRSVTAEMALRLARVLGTTPELWLNLQKNVDLYQAKLKLDHELKKLENLRPSEIRFMDI